MRQLVRRDLEELTVVYTSRPSNPFSLCRGELDHAIALLIAQAYPGHIDVSLLRVQKQSRRR